MIAAIAAITLSDPYDHKFHMIATITTELKKCPRGPGTNNDVLYSVIFLIATIATIFGEGFPHVRNDRYHRWDRTEVYLSDRCRDDRNERGRVVSI